LPSAESMVMRSRAMRRPSKAISPGSSPLTIRLRRLISYRSTFSSSRSCRAFRLLPLPPRSSGRLYFPGPHERSKVGARVCVDPLQQAAGERRRKSPALLPMLHQLAGNAAQLGKHRDARPQFFPNGPYFGSAERPRFGDFNLTHGHSRVITSGDSAMDFLRRRI
jgi:hypothetical protein